MKARFRLLRSLHDFFAGWRFAVCALVLLGAIEACQLAVLVIPKAETGLGSFAEDFRVWCYGLDRATGRMEWAYVAMFLLQPLMLSSMVGFIWSGELARAFQSDRRRMLPYVFGAVTFFALTLVMLANTTESARAATLPFPAKSLRRSVDLPRVVLTDQDGERLDVLSLRGRVVVVTGIYATCRHTCPLIMGQLSRSLARLSAPERSQVRVVALTLNPEHDNQKVMAEAARSYGVAAPEYRLLHGPAAEVNGALDGLEISRRADPMSGEIAHANLFLLVDKRGKLAYRLTLGSEQEEWLFDALRLLVAEDP
jgi:protein SCO1/2